MHDLRAFVELPARLASSWLRIPFGTRAPRPTSLPKQRIAKYDSHAFVVQPAILDGDNPVKLL